MIDCTSSPALRGTRHGFLGRTGGVSEGLIASLNTGLGSADNDTRVAENRRRARDAIAPDTTLLGLYQIHSADVVIADAPWLDSDRPRADAMVTNQPGLALGILTADCAPVLFADVTAGVIGAAHAGWKGALSGITDAMITAMETLGATRNTITAAIGPCIARTSYEVDHSFYERFCQSDADNDRFFVEGQRSGHAHFDLEAYVAYRLASAGIMRIDALGLDTYAQEARYYSFRRATHRKEPDYGRQISIIALS